MKKSAQAFLATFPFLHAVMALMFALIAIMLMVMAAKHGAEAFWAGMSRGSALAVIEAMGLLAAGVVALQIGQTIAEEEVVRTVHVSAPTRVRRFLSRFLVVIIVALAIEALVATFRAANAAERLLDAAAMIFAVGVLLAAWGIFIHLNRSAEELEPEAMEEAKREDRKLRK